MNLFTICLSNVKTAEAGKAGFSFPSGLIFLSTLHTGA